MSTILIHKDGLAYSFPYALSFDNVQNAEWGRWKSQSTVVTWFGKDFQYTPSYATPTGGLLTFFAITKSDDTPIYSIFTNYVVSNSSKSVYVDALPIEIMLSGNNEWIGGSDNDVFYFISNPNAASNTADGALGLDTFRFLTKKSDYGISNFNSVTDSLNVSFMSSNARFALKNIERLDFVDINIALDIGPTENAGSVYMLYKAAFNRPSDAGGMGYWIAQKDSGKNIVTDIAQGFVNSAEFIAKYGANPSNSSYVNNLYQNVLGRAGEAGGVTYWIGEMDAGRVSKASALVAFATLPEGASLVANLIANGIPYQEWVG